MNILLPDSGSVEVLGDRSTAAARDRVGYLPEERGLYKQMPVRRLLTYYGELKGGRRADVAARGRLVARAARPARRGRQEGAGALEGHVAEGPVHRHRRRAPGPGDPRRAVLRARSGQPRRAARRGARTQAARHDHRLQHARHVDGRADVRPHLHDLQGPQGARRIARRDPGARTGTTRCTCACRAAPPCCASIDGRRRRWSTTATRRRCGCRSTRRRSSAALTARTTVQRFEITRPSLHDIFVEIARPAPEDDILPTA